MNRRRCQKFLTPRNAPLLVSTYIVCERLSVMHEPVGVVEILVQNPQNTPYCEVQFQNTSPPPMKIVKESKSESFRIPL